MKNEENIIDITGGMNRVNVKVTALAVIVFFASCSFAQADAWDRSNLDVTQTQNWKVAFDK